MCMLFGLDERFYFAAIQALNLKSIDKRISFKTTTYVYRFHSLLDGMYLDLLPQISHNLAQVGISNFCVIYSV